MPVQNTCRRVVDSPVSRRVPTWRTLRRFFTRLCRNNRAVQDECGSSLVEFALTFSTMMAVVFTLMEICMAFYTYGMISESAREATRYAIVHGSTCVTGTSASCAANATAINTYAKGLGFPNIGGGNLSVTTTYLPNGSNVPDGNNVPGHRVHVDIQYVFAIRLPFVPSNSMSFDTSSEMYILQ